MRFAVIVSKDDEAGKNIASFLEGKLPDNMFLHFIEGNQCFANEVDQVEADFFIFASLHRSESAKPTLTVHSIGNWGKAEMGGKDNTLVKASAALNKILITTLEKEAKKQGIDWPVVAEADHHGPHLTKPTVFIEIGSSEKEWQNKEAGNVVASAILNCIQIRTKYRIAIGLGGTHYCPAFSKILLRTEVALGHIAPKYVLDSLELDLFKQMIEKTVEPVEFALIDWKGTNAKQRNKIISYCNVIKLNHKRVKDFL